MFRNLHIYLVIINIYVYVYIYIYTVNGLRGELDPKIKKGIK